MKQADILNKEVQILKVINLTVFAIALETVAWLLLICSCLNR